MEAVSEREAGPFGRFVYGLSRRRFGEAAKALTVLAHHPKLMLRYGLFAVAFERSSLVDDHLESLAALKAATMVGCEFCIYNGSTLSRGEGVTEEQFPDLEQSKAFSPLEDLVLRYAAALMRTPAVVQDELFDELESYLAGSTTPSAWGRKDSWRAPFTLCPEHPL